jgi:hypothetical protein
MIYKVTAKGSFRDIQVALNDAFFNEWDIQHITRRNSKGIVIIDVISTVSVTCIVEPIIGIELKFHNLTA